jgi:hypothetical protein
MNRFLFTIIAFSLLQGCASFNETEEKQGAEKVAEKISEKVSEDKTAERVEEKVEEKAVEKTEEKVAEKPVEKVEEKVAVKIEEKPVAPPAPPKAPPTREELAAERGFFHDTKTNRFFSNGKSAFSFRLSGVSKDFGAIFVSVNDGDYRPYTGKLSFDKEGLNRIKFSATDHLANSSPIQDFKIFVDKTPPVVKLHWQNVKSIETEPKFVNGKSSLSFMAFDAASGVSKIIIDENGVVTPFSAPLKFTEGKHSLRYYAIDNVGNKSEPVVLNFEVDSTPPTTRAVVKGGYYKGEGDAFVNGSAQLLLENVESKTGIVQIEFMLNGGPVTVYHEPFIITDAKMEIKFRGVDLAGNVEIWKIIRLISDSIPPIVKLETFGHFILNGSKFFASPGFYININAKDHESGVHDLAVAKDGKNFEKVADSKVVFENAGEFRFSARVTDKVGNATESSTYVVIIDNEAPISTIRTQDKLIFKNGIYYSALPNLIEIDADDKAGVGVAKIEFSYDGNSYQSYTGPIDVSQWKTRKQTIHYRAIDRLKNTEVAKIAQVEVQTDAPQIDLMVESDDAPEVPLSSLVEKQEGMKEETKAKPAVDIMVEAPGVSQVPVSKLVDQKKLDAAAKAKLLKKKKKGIKK